MPITFDADDYNNVRWAVDLDLTADALPDNVIASDVYAKEAIARIEAALSGFTEQQITDNMEVIKRAAILLTASFIAPRSKVLTAETLEGDRQQFQNKDLAKLATDLEGMAFDVLDRLIVAVLGSSAATDTAFAAGLFTTAKAIPK